MLETRQTRRVLQLCSSLRISFSASTTHYENPHIQFNVFSCNLVQSLRLHQGDYIRYITVLCTLITCVISNTGNRRVHHASHERIQLLFTIWFHTLQLDKHRKHKACIHQVESLLIIYFDRKRQKNELFQLRQFTSGILDNRMNYFSRLNI